MNRRLPYDLPGTVCAGHAMPGARALQAYLLTVFPGSSSLGIYNCRPVRGGRTLSFHAEGRAMDIKPTDDTQGFSLAEFAVEYAHLFGIQEVIDYRRRRRWDARRDSWDEYNSKGENHVHLTVTWASAKRDIQPRPNIGQIPNGEIVTLLLQQEPNGSVFVETDAGNVYECTEYADVADARAKGVPYLRIAPGSITQTGQRMS